MKSPIMLLRSAARVPLVRRAEAQARALGLDRLFVERPADAFPPTWTDLLLLYRLVRERRPDHVLELGSGCSTAILAQALYENRRGTLYTVDVDQHWLDVALSYVPKAAQAQVQPIYGPAVLSEYKGRQVWRHTSLPDVPLCMLYLDSPPLTAEVNVAVDPLDLEDRFRPGFVGVVDGRGANVAYLQQHLRRRFRWRRNPCAGTSFELGD
jgi:hypothetical protein